MMDFDKETMRSLMIDYIDGKITGELAKYVELHLEKNPEEKVEYEQLKEVIELMANNQEVEVPTESKAKFLVKAQLEFTKSKNTNPVLRKLNAPSLWKIAAAVALLIATYFGTSWFTKRAELINIQAELQKTKELVMMAMMKQESASERLKGIMASEEFTSVNEDIIDALVYALNNDGNINVRIAAAEALAKFSENEKARLSLIASLNNQSFPAVQLKLIDILVSMGDPKALDPMKEITNNQDVIKSVRDEAQMGIFKIM